jgi:hypothetical protein
MHIIKSIRILLVTAVMICFGAPLLIAQSPFDDTFQEEASRVGEHIEVFTDRTIYVVNERIQFRTDYRIESLEEGMPWSDVLYLELVSPSGYPYARSKHVITGGVSRSSLSIPPDMVTGNYYLKCYTRWMRNRGPTTFSYIPVRIINPFRTEVAEYSNGSQGIHPMERASYGTGLLEIKSPSSKFDMGKEALFYLSAPNAGYQETLQCCVTVVPVGAIDTIKGQLTRGKEISSAPGFSLNYLPDIGGASISGRLVHQDGSPGAYAMMYFTLLGSDPGFYVTPTDMDGRFVISTLGSTGEYEIFVAAKPYEDNQLEIRVDQDFDQGELHLPDREFEMSELERELATNMAIRMQLARTFEKEPVKDPLISDTAIWNTVLFYGTSGFRLDMEEFVNLPTLEEVFTNLVPDIIVVKKRGRRSFKVEGPNSNIALYPPLVMIDNIPVFDQEAVMALAPERIRRIDVVNDVYVRGDVSFGGVISILSRKGDMAGIDLPQGSYFFDFQTLEPLTMEVTEVPERGERMPDTRNTLLWLDDVNVEKGSPVEFRCIMPDQPGDYLVLVRGVTRTGEVQAATARFRVE